MLIYAYGCSAAVAGAAFLPFSAIMAVGSRAAADLALRIGSRAMLAVGSLVTASGYALSGLSAARPEYSFGLLPGLVLTGIGMTACVAPLTTVVLDAAPSDMGGSAMILPSIAGGFEPASVKGGQRRMRRTKPRSLG